MGLGKRAGVRRPCAGSREGFSGEEVRGERRAGVTAEENPAAQKAPERGLQCRGLAVYPRRRPPGGPTGFLPPPHTALSGSQMLAGSCGAPPSTSGVQGGLDYQSCDTGGTSGVQRG